MSESKSVALGTRGIRAIGRGIVRALAGEGWVVAFAWRERDDGAQRLAGEPGDTVHPFRLDLRD